LDYYLDSAEPEVLTDWVQFHEGLQARVRQNGTTDANGILLMDQGFSKLLRLEDGNEAKYDFIDTMDNRHSKTGYFFAGFDSTNAKQQIMVVKNGDPLASTTLYWWDVTIALMAAAAGSYSALPAGFQNCLDYWAAKKYWEDQGPSMKKEADHWKGEYNTLLVKGRELYSNPTKDPEFVESFDEDAGEYGVDIRVTSS
jgi:hypothetical protein